MPGVELKTPVHLGRRHHRFNRRGAVQHRTNANILREEMMEIMQSKIHIRGIYTTVQYEACLPTAHEIARISVHALVGLGNAQLSACLLYSRYGDSLCRHDTVAVYGVKQQPASSEIRAPPDVRSSVPPNPCRLHRVLAMVPRIQC